MADVNFGYSTHILGTVKQAKSCLGIVLYDKYKFQNVEGYNKISLYNLEQDYEVIIENGPYLKLTREKVGDSFQYLHTNRELSSGFNVIIYLDPVTSSPVGYTEFSNNQGKNRDLTINLELSASVNTLDIVLNNNLSIAERVDREYTGTGLNEYTSGSVLKSDVLSIQPKYPYSKFLSQAQYSGGAITDAGLVKKIEDELKFVKVGIARNVVYSPTFYNFTNFNVSFLGDDIVLCAWNGINYCISSLSKKNDFGNLITYTKSTTGYYTLLQDDGSTNVIKYAAGKYLVCESVLKTLRVVTRVFDFTTRSWVKTINPNVFVDPCDQYNRVYDLPSSISYEQAYLYLPEISNSFYSYLDTDYVNVVRKTGNWIVTSRVESGKRLYMISGLSFSLYIKKEELDDIIFLDDNTLILKRDDELRVYRGIGETRYTESAAELIGGKLNTKYEIIRLGDDIMSSILNPLRRGAIPENGKVPEVVCGFSGYLFYTTEDYKINFL